MLNSLYECFIHAAKQYPDNPCLVSIDKQYNYREALLLVNQIYKNLTNNGIEINQTVALYADKSIDAVLVFLALSKLGAVCLTLDNAFPAEMIEYVLGDAKVSAVVTLKALSFDCKLKVLSKDELILDAALDNQALNQSHAKDFVNATHTAWLVYSSGSTGVPKGIKISSHAMSQSILARAEFSPYQRSDRVACNIYFYWEVFRPLFFGAASVVLSDATLFDLQQYLKFISKNNISETLWTPSFAEMLVNNVEDDALSTLVSLKRVWLNGEVVNETLSLKLSRALPNVRLINLYSISETFDACGGDISSTQLNDGFTSIGKPFAGVECKILADDLKPCPSKTEGELYIHSPYLAEGYINREKEEQQAFIDINHKRYFKTKDIAYQDDMGNIYILGRNDHIVKLRGYNVSLLSIENALKKHLGVSRCHVYLDESQATSSQIIALLESSDVDGLLSKYAIDKTTGISRVIQQTLQHHLPSYAIPSRYFVEEHLSINGYSSKLDRKTIVNNKRHKDLKSIWSKILSLPVSEINDNSDFFELGGNSLNVAELISHVRKHLSASITVDDIENNAKFISLNQRVGGGEKPHRLKNVDLKKTLYIETPKHFTSKTGSLRLADAKHVFITGATGFIGAHWLAESLATTNGMFHCLVRADDTKMAFKRLQDTFLFYKLDIRLLEERVTVYSGNLTENNLGLPLATFQSLCDDIDFIFHAASDVNLLYSYERLMPVTVDGFRRLLSLALEKRVKPLVLLSSDAVYPDGHDVLEDDFLDVSTLATLTYGYAQAKWVQEQLLGHVSKQYQLPYVLFRLGNVAPSLENGVNNPKDLNHQLLQFIRAHKSAPKSLCIEFTSIDDVICEIMTSLQRDIRSNIINISQRNVISSDTLVNYLSDDHIKLVDDDTWCDLLYEHQPMLASLWPIKSLFNQRTYQLRGDNSQFGVLSPRRQKQLIALLAKDDEEATN